MNLIATLCVLAVIMLCGCNKKSAIHQEICDESKNMAEITPFEGDWIFIGTNHPWHQDLAIYGYRGIIKVTGLTVELTFTKTGDSSEYYEAIIPVRPEDRGLRSVTYKGLINKVMLDEPFFIDNSTHFYVVTGLPLHGDIDIDLSKEQKQTLLLGSHDPPWAFSRSAKN